MELDAELQKIKEYLDAPKVGMVNAARQQEVFDAYAIIKNLIMFESVDASIEMNEDALQTGAMVIEVTTSDITVYDMEAFAEAIKNADNFQIFPTADDRVKFDILFEGVIEYTLT